MTTEIAGHIDPADDATVRFETLAINDRFDDKGEWIKWTERTARLVGSGGVEVEFSAGHRVIPLAEPNSGSER